MKERESVDRSKGGRREVGGVKGVALRAGGTRRVEGKVWRAETKKRVK